jgi:predicted murein hydrolase (TIGR00659 family)
MNSLSTLSREPLLWIALTVGLYLAAQRLQKALGGFALLNPVLIAGAILALFLGSTGIPLVDYDRGGQWIHFLLGPATVALAVPLFNRLHQIRQSLMPVLVSVAAGAVTAAGSAAGISRALGASATTVLSMTPKSVSTPIAIGVAEKIGADPGRTVLFVVVTGILGAMTGTGLFRLLGIRDRRAQGMALGVAAHGIGTSRAVEIGETEGAFASLAMGLTGLLTAVLLPFAVRLFR